MIMLSPKRILCSVSWRLLLIPVPKLQITLQEKKPSVSHVVVVVVVVVYPASGLNDDRPEKRRRRRAALKLNTIVVCTPHISPSLCVAATAAAKPASASSSQKKTGSLEPPPRHGDYYSDAKFLVGFCLWTAQDARGTERASGTERTRVPIYGEFRVIIFLVQ